MTHRLVLGFGLCFTCPTIARRQVQRLAVPAVYIDTPSLSLITIRLYKFT